MIDYSSSSFIKHLNKNIKNNYKIENKFKNYKNKYEIEI